MQLSRDIFHFLWLLALCVVCHGASDVSPPARLLMLRQQQGYASMQAYVNCQQEIDALTSQQAENGAEQQATWYAYLHAVPWILWQLCAILAAICLVYMLVYMPSGMTIIGIIVSSGILVISLYATWCCYDELERERAVVCALQAYAYLGPSQQYPCCGQLDYLKEGVVQAYDHDWVKIRYDGGYGWIPRRDLLLYVDVVDSRGQEYNEDGT